MRLALARCPDHLIRELTAILPPDEVALDTVPPGRAAAADWDVILAAAGLPDEGTEPGTEHVRWLRQHFRRVPILVVADGADADAVVEALDAGADAVMKTPLDGVELRLRLRRLAARAAPPPAERLRHGSLVLDRLRHTVEGPEGTATLTPREYQVLQYLLLRAERVVPRSEIVQAVWWDRDRPPAANLLDVHVSHLRRKLEAAGLPDLLHTVRGVGFLLEGEDTNGTGRRTP